MKMYFDNNVYNRPFDDWSIPRNRSEALVILELFEWAGTGRVNLVSSFVLEAEQSRLEDHTRRMRVEELMSFSRVRIAPAPEIYERAHELEQKGFGAADALHISAAEYGGVDCFVTCDDKLLKRARRIGLFVEVVSPRTVLEEELR